MKNFVVLIKPIQPSPQLDSKSISYDLVQVDYLLQELTKKDTGMGQEITKNYEIDEKSISFQQIDGRLCVVMLAFRK